MRNLVRILFATAALGAVIFASQAQKITGDYLESRSADVYVAQCFANGEVGLVGDQALLAWHVRDGSWNGHKLDGLTVIAAVKANKKGCPLLSNDVLVRESQDYPGAYAS